ncbi:hypothetical protein Hamer_G009034 [Homarus americanus]|uniref:Uncharacterized protein n=1 Tax=Homarus americanus TaxID=6706 RepID=A0A8J5N942_HOMAM|nr:hypothetical protein Hamer_G009034 [Homarus americanus]
MGYCTGMTDYRHCPQVRGGHGWVNSTLRFQIKIHVLSSLTTAKELSWSGLPVLVTYRWLRVLKVEAATRVNPATPPVTLTFPAGALWLCHMACVTQQ